MEELRSSEKLEGHSLKTSGDGTVTCQKCNLFSPSKICPTVDSLRSRPCSGKTMTKVSTQLQVLFSDDWPQDLRVAMKNLKHDEWQAISHNGRKIRFTSRGDLSHVPEPFEFPLLLQPIPHEQLEHEALLERLRLEEALLEEQLRLVALEKHHLNATIPASSTRAPWESHLVPTCL